MNGLQLASYLISCNNYNYNCESYNILLQPFKISYNSSLKLFFNLAMLFFICSISIFNCLYPSSLSFHTIQNNHQLSSYKCRRDDLIWTSFPFTMFNFASLLQWQYFLTSLSLNCDIFKFFKHLSCTITNIKISHNLMGKTMIEQRN